LNNVILKNIAIIYLLLCLLIIFLGSNLGKYYLTAIPLVKMIQWDRFYFLMPALTILFVVVLISSLKRKIPVAFLLIIFIGFSLWGFVTDNNWNSHLRKLLNKPTVNYAQFFREDLFGKVRSYLDGENYSRVVALGYHPAVNVFNKIKSADGYLGNYRLESKHQMYEIIEGELEKNPAIYNYFQNWGSRCYFFNSELPTSKLYYKQEGFSFKTPFSYDFVAAHKAGIDYILSIYPISDEISAQLEYKKKFVDADGYEVLVYFIK
jgi:hypothetical protein